MASTRNNNTKGNYCLQQRSIRMQREHLEYVHGATGTAYDPSALLGSILAICQLLHFQKILLRLNLRYSALILLI